MLIIALSIGLAFVKKYVPDFPLKEVFTLWAIIIPAYFGKRLFNTHKSFNRGHDV